MSNPFKRIRDRFKAYRRYRRTVVELSTLNDRELKDMGLTRGDIRAVALKTWGTSSCID